MRGVRVSGENGLFFLDTKFFAIELPTMGRKNGHEGASVNGPILSKV